LADLAKVSKSRPGFSHKTILNILRILVFVFRLEVNNMKKGLIIVGAVILAGLVAAGSFWAGMTYQTNKAEQSRANFINARGQFGDGQFPQDGQLPGGDQFFQEGQLPGAGQGGVFGRGGTFGQVKSVDGNELTISTAQDVATVHTSDATQIEKTVLGSISDLQPGTRVLVVGQNEKDGTLSASLIQIVSENAANPPPGTEP
jgi:hypothetical protein